MSKSQSPGTKVDPKPHVLTPKEEIKRAQAELEFLRASLQPKRNTFAHRLRLISILENYDITQKGLKNAIYGKETSSGSEGSALKTDGISKWLSGKISNLKDVTEVEIQRRVVDYFQEMIANKENSKEAKKWAAHLNWIRTGDLSYIFEYTEKFNEIIVVLVALAHVQVHCAAVFNRCSSAFKSCVDSAGLASVRGTTKPFPAEISTETKDGWLNTIKLLRSIGVLRQLEDFYERDAVAMVDKHWDFIISACERDPSAIFCANHATVPIMAMVNAYNWAHGHRDKNDKLFYYAKRVEWLTNPHLMKLSASKSIDFYSAMCDTQAMQFDRPGAQNIFGVPSLPISGTPPTPSAPTPPDTTACPAQPAHTPEH